ncbi:MAG: CPBP family intramembrane metalloprotease [Lachnospiraceae bacterium]|nr:CPBP family intramembrane metalloprotease [Lachnospiraceae bacterium]
MDTRSKKKSITASFVMFALVIVMLLFIATPIQMMLGMTGVLITELIFLAMAILGAIVMKEPLREVFPLHRPHARQVFGSLLLWAAAYLLVLFSTLLIGFLFPEQMGEVQTGLSDVITSVPFGIRFLIVAVSPAICEEAVHRGFILHFLKPVQKKWAIVVIMGILFGIFHLDPIRFLATAILGMALTYAALETDNMFYSFLIHLINNTLSVLATRVTENMDADAMNAQSSITLSVVGAYLLFLCIAPWLLWAAVSLLHPKKTEKTKGTGKIVLACVLTSAFCVVGGIALTSLGMLGNAITTGSQTPTVSELSETPYTTDFTLEKGGSQQLTAVLNTPAGRLHISIADDNGNIAYETTAQKLTGNFPLNLENGHYTMTVELVELPDDAGASDELVSFYLILLEL